MTKIPTVAELVARALEDTAFFAEAADCITDLETWRAARTAADETIEVWQADQLTSAVVPDDVRAATIATLVDAARLFASKAENELLDAIEAGDIVLDADGDPQSVSYDIYRSAA